MLSPMDLLTETQLQLAMLQQELGQAVRGELPEWERGPIRVNEHGNSEFVRRIRRFWGDIVQKVEFSEHGGMVEASFEGDGLRGFGYISGLVAGVNRTFPHKMPLGVVDPDINEALDAATRTQLAFYRLMIEENFRVAPMAYPKGDPHRHLFEREAVIANQLLRREGVTLPDRFG